MIASLCYAAILFVKCLVFLLLLDATHTRCLVTFLQPIYEIKPRGRKNKKKRDPTWRGSPDLNLLNGLKDFLGRGLDDTTRHRQACAMLEVEINLASCLTTLINAPKCK